MNAIQGQKALLPQSPYKKKIRIRPSHIKYIGVFLVGFVMIAAAKVFVNYASIQTSITNVIKQREELERHKQYLALQAYIYQQPDSQVFVAHDNSILLPGERIMANVTVGVVATGGEMTGESIEVGVTSGVVEQHTGLDTELLPPWKSWVLYFGQKIEEK